MKECKKIEKTANKDRQFFQQNEKVKVFHCCPVSPTVTVLFNLLSSVDDNSDSDS